MLYWGYALLDVHVTAIFCIDACLIPVEFQPICRESHDDMVFDIVKAPAFEALFGDTLYADFVCITSQF